MSRYSNYSSRYGDSARDYSSSSYLGSGRSGYGSSGTSARSSTYTPRSYDSYSSPYTSYSSSKYGDYTSKYGSSSRRTTDDKMEETNGVAPIVKDEIEELNYGEPTTPVDEQAPTEQDQQEVLHESQIEEFNQEEEENAAEDEVENQEEEEEEEEDHQLESKPAEILLVPAPQMVDEPEVRKDFHAPASVDENRTPSPTVLNAKKFGSVAWPPKNDDILDGKKEGADTEAVPKKRVSDLIARFNTGNVDNETKKSDASYKSEYGAGTNVGKVNHNFA